MNSKNSTHSYHMLCMRSDTVIFRYVNHSSYLLTYHHTHFYNNNKLEQLPRYDTAFLTVQSFSLLNEECLTGEYGMQLIAQTSSYKSRAAVRLKILIVINRTIKIFNRD